MVTDQQVALLRQRQMEGKKQQTAAAMAGMSKRSARKWQCGPLASETKQERRWRTRPDPFDGVWEKEILPLLRGEAAGRLRATTIIEWLEEKVPGRFSASHLRTLQRRLQDWRALNGPDQEVYFPQEHPLGREAQLDFTHCNSLGVTIGGRRYRHLLFQLVLSHSGWRYAEVVAGETFLALKQGLQNALWELGGAPQVIRSDNTSALTHEIKRSRGRALNDNYAELLDHYGLESTLINSGVRVRDMTRKWGSCSTSGTITLATDLSHQEVGFQDFVIAHELLHLRVPNHGKLFKALMNAHVPDWKTHDVVRAVS